MSFPIFFITYKNTHKLSFSEHPKSPLKHFIGTRIKNNIHKKNKTHLTHIYQYIQVIYTPTNPYVFPKTKEGGAYRGQAPDSDAGPAYEIAGPNAQKASEYIKKGTPKGARVKPLRTISRYLLKYTPRRHGDADESANRRDNRFRQRCCLSIRVRKSSWVRCDSR